MVAVAAEAHEQRLLVEEADAAPERMHVDPRLERLLDCLGDGTSLSRPPLPRT